VDHRSNTIALVGFGKLNIPVVNKPVSVKLKVNKMEIETAAS